VALRLEQFVHELLISPRLLLMSVVFVEAGANFQQLSAQLVEAVQLSK